MLVHAGSRWSGRAVQWLKWRGSGFRSLWLSRRSHRRSPGPINIGMHSCSLSTREAYESIGGRILFVAAWVLFFTVFIAGMPSSTAAPLAVKCASRWPGLMKLIQGACHGGTRYWLDQGDGIDLWGCAVGHVTWAGSGRWDWFMGYVMGAHNWIGEMGLIWGGTPLGCDTGWDTSWGHDWIREMGLICGGTPWRCDTGWIWIMRLIYRGIPWGGGGGGATGSGRWNWFVQANHWGAWHWLDLGEGIDLCGRVMRARDTGWIGAMGLIHGGVSNGKVLYGCWM